MRFFLISDRTCRKGVSFDEAWTEIVRMSGTQFDPVAVEAFVPEESALREMVELKCGRLLFDAEEECDGRPHDAGKPPVAR